MAHQLVLFDSIASTNCRSAMNIQGSWKDHFDQKVLSSEFFLPFHTAILALGLIVNLFEGGQYADPQYSSSGEAHIDKATTLFYGNANSM